MATAGAIMPMAMMAPSRWLLGSIGSSPVNVTAPPVSPISSCRPISSLAKSAEISGAAVRLRGMGIDGILSLSYCEIGGAVRLLAAEAAVDESFDLADTALELNGIDHLGDADRDEPDSGDQGQCCDGVRGVDDQYDAAKRQYHPE
ncbi:Uncharacterised protein [Mycobacteroides abscessus subsp. abscessus]|nr:Uncharacterised protein [Mycobacteroides abscessus subsp. abscessus]